MTKITCDFETQSEVNLKKSGAFEYSNHPSTRVMCFAFGFAEDKPIHLLNFAWSQRPWAELPIAFKVSWAAWVGDPNTIFEAHNAFFEQCIYENILVKRLGWPAIPIYKWRCSAAMAASCAIPRNLKDAGAVMRTPVQKDFEGHRVMMKLCKPTAAWTKWAKARADVDAGKRVGPKVREVAERPEPAKFWTPETAPEDFKKLYHYCKFDVKSEMGLSRELPALTPFEQELWIVDQRINFRGIQVDMPLVNRISKIMADEARTMAKELDVLTMGLVSSGNARDAILDFLSLEGLELPDLKAKTVDDFLANGKATGDAAAVLKIRRALSKSSTAKYGMFKLRGATDGRARDILLYHAASTGRWGGKGIQPQNFPRGVIKDIFEAIYRINTCSVDDLKLLYGENLMPLFSSVLRGMFIASPNHNMFVEDYSAIECRVLWWLAGHEAGLQKFRDNLDPYKIRAADIFRKSILEITDDERQVGKAAELGCGYQMGDAKFVTSAWDVYRAKVTRDLAKVAVTSFRKDNYPVVELWGYYQDAAIAAAENPTKKYRVGQVRFFMDGRFLKIQLPSGRKLSYADPKVMVETVYPHVVDGETKYTSDPAILRAAVAGGAEAKKSFQSKKFTFMSVNHKARKEDCEIPKWTREKTYGGKLVENVVQAVARDILAEAIVRAEKRGFSVLMHSHDEMVSEAPIGRFELVDDGKGGTYCPEYRAVMEELPTWAVGLPLKASGWAGDRYKKG